MGLLWVIGEDGLLLFGLGEHGHGILKMGCVLDE